MAEKPSDFNMPEKIVTKLLKDSLPDNIIISRDAKSAAARGASIFILQLVIAANDHAHAAGRSKFNTQDIIAAIADVGLGEYATNLVRFNAQLKRNAKRKESSLLKKKAEKEAAKGLDRLLVHKEKNIQLQTSCVQSVKPATSNLGEVSNMEVQVNFNVDASIT